MQLYFTSLKSDAENRGYSEIEPIKIDKQNGQIVNWPAGFMDVQVAEARRLLDILYGQAEKGRPEKNE